VTLRGNLQITVGCSLLALALAATGATGQTAHHPPDGDQIPGPECLTPIKPNRASLTAIRTTWSVRCRVVLPALPLTPPVDESITELASRTAKLGLAARCTRQTSSAPSHGPTADGSVVLEFMRSLHEITSSRYL